MPTFKHSGAIGDVIYALPTVRALGGGTMLLPTGKPSNFWNAFYGDPLPILRRLLEAQPYITTVQAYESQPVDYDLDDFRKFFALHCYLETVTLCDMHLMSFGLGTGERDEPWLTVMGKPLPDGRSVILCRSQRYRSAFFNWRRLLDQVGERAVFCGLPVEHQAFEEEVGPVPYLPTSDLYELAQYICTCALFVGNQSSPYAIAEGLKVNTIQEVSPDCPNCIFIRPGAQYHTVY
jgi:hypothetical protein